MHKNLDPSHAPLRLRLHLKNTIFTLQPVFHMTRIKSLLVSHIRLYSTTSGDNRSGVNILY